MSLVAVEKINENKATDSSDLDEVRSLSERIRQRAFETYERRGWGDGSAIDDWLNAERELFRIPESELIEKGDKFEARMSAPGFDPDEIQVVALPDALIVKGSSVHKHDKTEGDVRFCEFDRKTLFRRLDWPEPIDVDRVTASLEKGVLEVTALKSQPESARGKRSIAA